MSSHMMKLNRSVKTAPAQIPREDSGQQTIEAILAEEAAEDIEPEKHWLLDSRCFNIVIYGLIMFNSVQMGLATDNPDWGGWTSFEHLFTALFTVEMVIKFYVLRGAYFKCGWNQMDCFLVWMSILDNWIVAPLTEGTGSVLSQFSVLRVLRVVRVARMARLLKVFKELYIILKGIFESLRTMFWVSMLLLLTLYVASILLVDVLGRKQNSSGETMYEGFDDDPVSIEADERVAGWNNYIYFGTIVRSMYTLFNIVILSEFSEIGRPVVEKQPVLMLFFIWFIVFTTFGVLNVIIGVIVDNTMEAAKSMERDEKKDEIQGKLKILQQIRDVVFKLDKDESGSISLDEVEEGWQNPELRAMLQDVNLPKGWMPSELMCLLDADGDGELTCEEFMRSFYRLVASDPFQQSCCMHAALNEVKAGVNKVSTEQSSLREEMDEKFEGIDKELKARFDRMDEKLEARLDRIEQLLAAQRNPTTPLLGHVHGQSREQEPKAEFFTSAGEKGSSPGSKVLSNLPSPCRSPTKRETAVNIRNVDMFESSFIEPGDLIGMNGAANAGASPSADGDLVSSFSDGGSSSETPKPAPPRMRPPSNPAAPPELPAHTAVNLE